MEEKKPGDMFQEGGSRPIMQLGEHPLPPQCIGPDGWPIVTVEQLINGEG
jgi:hypothetical protein